MVKIDFCKNWIYKNKNIDLPHDASLELERNKDLPSGSGSGYFVGEKNTYIKEFEMPKYKNIWIAFEGIYRKARVKINGTEVGFVTYGYSELILDITKFLKEGKNVVEVEVDNSQLPNSRWYTGTGIYRPVYLYCGNELYIKPDGIKIDILLTKPALIDVKVASNSVNNLIKIFDNDNLIYEGNQGEIEIKDPILWSEKNPHLYKCKAYIIENNKIADEEETTFGIRKITKGKNNLYINDEPILLRGGCVHHDNGILGSCCYKDAEFRKIKRLKDAGFNAIRSAHNPCSRFLLEACDFYGMYVIDETWDMWYQRKTRYDYALDFLENYEFDIKSMVNKDYNHPSVIMYSIGNELSEPTTNEKGLEMTKKIVSLIKSLDKSRMTTGGFNLMLLSRAANGQFQYSDNDPSTTPMNSSMVFNMWANIIGTGMNKTSGSSKVDKIISPIMDEVDIAGYNYASGRYLKDYKLHPKRIIYGSETFPQDIYKNWEFVKQIPNVIGDFMWTAWDYLGEAGIGAWAYTKDGAAFNKPYPWLLGDVGVFDILGNPNGELYLAQAAWNKLDGVKIAVRPVNKPKIKIAKQTWRGTNSISSWSWNGCDGNKTTIEVYSTDYKVRLLINNKVIGAKRVKNGLAIFKTKYKKGNICAQSLDKYNNIKHTKILESADKYKINVVLERDDYKIGDLVFANVLIMDNHGNVESNDDKEVTIEVKGAELLGFGSANPRNDQKMIFKTNKCKTYYGRALAILKLTSNCMNLKVSSEEDEKSLVYRKDNK